MLSSPGTSEQKKPKALKYLRHWVNQPLHVSFQDDRGANEIGVSGGLCSGLHAVWDGCIIEQGVPGYACAVAGVRLGGLLNKTLGD